MNMQNPNPFNYGAVQPNPPYTQQTNNNGSSLFQSPNIQNSKSASLSGRYINDYQELTNNDVPLDGSTGIFPKSDGSCIYTVRKSWDNNGTVKVEMYVPYVAPQQQPSEPTNSEFSQVMAELKELKKLIKKPYYNRGKQKRQEVSSNE